jgi:Fe-Mn family superoxide dismutase
MSAETLDYHYGKHHSAYVNNLNNFVKTNEDLQNKTLEEIIKTSSGGIFNNAA